MEFLVCNFSQKRRWRNHMKDISTSPDSFHFFLYETQPSFKEVWFCQQITVNISKNVEPILGKVGLNKGKMEKIPFSICIQHLIPFLAYYSVCDMCMLYLSLDMHMLLPTNCTKSLPKKTWVRDLVPKPHVVPGKLINCTEYVDISHIVWDNVSFFHWKETK